MDLGLFSQLLIVQLWRTRGNSKKQGTHQLTSLTQKAPGSLRSYLPKYSGKHWRKTVALWPLRHVHIHGSMHTQNGFLTKNFGRKVKLNSKDSSWYQEVHFFVIALIWNYLFKCGYFSIILSHWFTESIFFKIVETPPLCIISELEKLLLINICDKNAPGIWTYILGSVSLGCCLFVCLFSPTSIAEKWKL